MNLKPTKPLSGFVELTPAQQRCFDENAAKMVDSLKTAGFGRLDLPTIERFEVLTDKDNFEDIETEMYVFEKGDTKMGLRYDGTIGLARFVAGHINDLTFPFRAYQFAKNYRGERPQKGRYREFYQMDLDILGQGDLSPDYDIEIITTMNDALTSIKDTIGNVYVRVGSRAVWNQAFAALGVVGEDKIRNTLIIIDKREKMPADEFAAALRDAAGADAANKIAAAFDNPKSLAGISSELDDALAQLEMVVQRAQAAGVDARLDLSIVRGHGYYTGVVFEYYFADSDIKTQIGGGGRYENLVSKFSKAKIVGVGAGFGPSRLLVPLIESGKLDLSKYERQADVAVLPMGAAQVDAALNAVRAIRAAGLVAVPFLDTNKKFKAMMEYADKIRARFAMIIGEDEAKAGLVALKDMTTGQQASFPVEQAIKKVKDS